MAMLTAMYGFLARPTVWFQETVTGFPVDTVAGDAFDAASKTTCAWTRDDRQTATTAHAIARTALREIFKSQPSNYWTGLPLPAAVKPSAESHRRIAEENP